MEDSYGQPLALSNVATGIQNLFAAADYISYHGERATVAYLIGWRMPNGCPWDIGVNLYAAQYGHLAVLKWLHSIGYSFDKWTCASAARIGHLDVVKWLHENGCPWDESTCTSATKRHLDVVKW